METQREVWRNKNLKTQSSEQNDLKLKMITNTQQDQRNTNYRDTDAQQLHKNTHYSKETNTTTKITNSRETQKIKKTQHD